MYVAHKRSYLRQTKGMAKRKRENVKMKKGQTSENELK